MTDDLQQLKDIHLPQAIHMWPIAPGWISLFALLIILMLCALSFWYKTHRKKYTVNFALAKLEKLKQLSLDNPEINIAGEISLLLRRTALYYFPRQDIAGLSGNEWLDFLNQSGETKNFNQKTGHLLTDAPYRKNNVTDVTPLFALARAWLRTIAKKM